jgi:pyrroloquinoline quinone biosynthesis protein B
VALRALVLGSAAGGGLPQWNCRAECSASAWEGSDGLKPATQSSLAVSVDGETWVLLNASPDLRAQILATPQLHPRAAGAGPEAGLRNTPIRSVVLTNGDVDHVAGLLTMRERQAFTIWMTAEIAAVLERNPIFEVLDRAVVARRVVGLDQRFEPADGLAARLFPVPGKIPLWLEGEAEGEVVETDRMGEQTAGVELSAGDTTAFYIPGCERMVPALADRLRGAALVFFDGTVFHDDEMIRAGVGAKTGRRMGHMAMAGAEGSLAAFAGLEVGRKIYVHMNNTNPVWLPGSPERAEAEAAGWEIAHDGMEISL